ncbi:MAG: lysozyme [Caulobacterales bacterium]
MNPRLQVSRAAVELIEAFEGYRAQAAQLPSGRWTIGYGHTRSAREGAKVSEREAEALLLYDLIAVSHAVNEHVYTPLTQNQFDALVSFAFNIGVENFQRSATRRRLNEGRMLEAALAMELWRKSDLEGQRIVVDALVRRRAAEKALFLKPTDGWVPAPTPVLPPHIDYDVAAYGLTESPAVVSSILAGDRTAARREADTEEPLELTEVASASEVAAAAVISRLESILADTEETPAQQLVEAPEQSTRASAPESAMRSAEIAAEEMAMFSTVKMMPPRTARIHPIFFVALAAIGAGFLAAAAQWGFRAPPAEVLGIPAVTAGWAIGLIGVACVASAVYFLLERIGAQRNRRRL